VSSGGTSGWSSPGHAVPAEEAAVVLSFVMLVLDHRGGPRTPERVTSRKVVPEASFSERSRVSPSRTTEPPSHRSESTAPEQGTGAEPPCLEECRACG
jgi:hypothetical protein